MLERALAIEELEYGPDHREVDSALERLSSMYGDLGDTA